jgi:hypothetical protein
MPPRPDVVAAAHAHSLYGKTWSSLGRSLDPITQDVCAFYDDHSLFTDFTGFVYKTSEGERIAEALGNKKAECFDYSTANWIAHGRLVPNSNRYGPHRPRTTRPARVSTDGARASRPCKGRKSPQATPSSSETSCRVVYHAQRGF